VSTRLIRVFVGIALIAAVACARSSGATDRSPKPGRISEPRINNAGQLRFSVPARNFDFRIEVPVDEQGRADVTGMRVMGNMPNTTREDIAAWLSRATFHPARQDGVPVRGIFKMQLRNR
jgi:hypothetical protein